MCNLIFIRIIGLIQKPLSFSKLILTKRVLIAQLDKHFRSLDGISSRVYKRRPREGICDESIFDNLK